MKLLRSQESTDSCEQYVGVVAECVPRAERVEFRLTQVERWHRHFDPRAVLHPLFDPPKSESPCRLLLAAFVVSEGREVLGLN